MKRAIQLLLLGAVVGAVAAAPAAAQSGFALKGHYIVNSTVAREAQENREIPTADGFGLGAELVLPLGIGVGVSAYTASDTDTFGSGAQEFTSREFTVLGEANYFLNIPLLPISPYAGVHAGLGILNGEDSALPNVEIRDKNRSQLGFQLGVRIQPTRLLGLDAQWRRMSTSAAEGQDGRFERDQFLVGVTIF